jgi:antitoxin VapB
MFVRTYAFNTEENSLDPCIYISIYYGKEEQGMLSTKVFISGNSQAIRLPREYQVDDKELYIQKIGNTILLIPKTNPWETFEKSLSEFSDDFMVDGRNQPGMQEREGL